MHPITQKLLAPLPATCVRFKPIRVDGRKALVVPYLNVLAVIKRLDEVFSTGGWSDSYQPLASGAFLCTLRVKIDNEWVVRSDAGDTGEGGSDKGGQAKNACTSALKRTAGKLGIGRYLRVVKPQWVEYDPQTRQVVGTPALPAWAMPEPAKVTSVSANGRRN